MRSIVSQGPHYAIAQPSYQPPQIQRQPVGLAQSRSPYQSTPTYQPQAPFPGYRAPPVRPQPPTYPQYTQSTIPPQVYQQPRPTQSTISRQSLPNQTSFRPPQQGPVYQARPQQPFVIPSSPVRTYENVPQQYVPQPQRQILTPNRFVQSGFAQPQIQVLPPQGLPQSFLQQPPQHFYPAQQPQPQPPQQQQQQPPKLNDAYNPQLHHDEDLEQKFEDAIKKTKQLVSKYQKPEEAQPQQAPQDSTENDLQDLALQYEDGYIYRGQGIEPSTREGYGILCDQNENEVYSGYWHDNQYHGQGKLVNFQAEVIDGPFNFRDLNAIDNGWSGYDGGFVEGKMSGKGVLSLTNGERFDGTFVEGTIEGAGQYYTLEGQVVQGYWKDGNLENEYE